MCKIIQACSNFRGTVAANWLLSATACQSAIFGKIGKKTINLAGIILHLSVVQNLLGSRKGYECGSASRYVVTVTVDASSRLIA